MDRKICYYLDEVENIFEGRLQYPITCEIDPSNYCQNKCSWCINSKFLKDSRVHLNLGLYCLLLRELKKCGVKSITFTGGGEPTLNPVFGRMVREAISYEFEVGLVTNGIEISNYIGSLESFTFVRISLDAGFGETYHKIKGSEPYVFKKVLENIKELVKIKADNNLRTAVGISFVACDKNMQDIERVRSLGDELGVSYVQVKPVISDNVEKFNPNISEGGKVFFTSRYSSDKVTRKACHIAGLIGNVCANGKMYYCCIHRGEKNFLLGDLETESFSSIWEKRRKFHPDISKCMSCRYMNYVKGYEKFSQEKYSFLRHKYFL